MTKVEALKLMATSSSVADWNEKREKVKTSVTSEEWAKIYPFIDTEGLIVKTLKTNRRKMRVQK